MIADLQALNDKRSMICRGSNTGAAWYWKYKALSNLL
jgi:hypothetical protein